MGSTPHAEHEQSAPHLANLEPYQDSMETIRMVVSEGCSQPSAGRCARVKFHHTPHQIRVEQAMERSGSE